MAKETIAFLEEVVGGSAHLVGWSDGGNIALLVAIERPDLVRKVVASGANYDTGGLEMPTGGIEHDEPGLAMMKSLYTTHSPDGGEHWPVHFGKTKAMWEDFHLPLEALTRIIAPTLVVSADDEAVKLEHTIEMYRTIPDAEFAVVPGTSHMLFLEKPALVNEIIIQFLKNDRAPTLMPVRRAP
jgi:pimeloyl-ACP methyl ester carboxylesterase